MKRRARGAGRRSLGGADRAVRPVGSGRAVPGEWGSREARVLVAGEARLAVGEAHGPRSVTAAATAAGVEQRGTVGLAAAAAGALGRAADAAAAIGPARAVELGQPDHGRGAGDSDEQSKGES